MIFSAVYYRQRARRAIDEANDVRAAYKNLRDSYATVLTRLDLANQREEALQVALAVSRKEHTDVAELLSLVELERDEARREIDEVRAALVWLERDFKVGGAA